MKRDMDLIRNLLLEIEEKDGGNNGRIDFDKGKISENTIVEHLFLMHTANLIEGINASTMSCRGFLAQRLTWQGHDFLDSVRDPEIWQKTKDGAMAAGGFTVELLGEIAKGLLRTQIKKFTGVEF